MASNKEKFYKNQLKKGKIDAKQFAKIMGTAPAITEKNKNNERVQLFNRYGSDPSLRGKGISLDTWKNVQEKALRARLAPIKQAQAPQPIMPPQQKDLQGNVLLPSQQMPTTDIQGNVLLPSQMEAQRPVGPKPQLPPQADNYVVNIQQQNPFEQYKPQQRPLSDLEKAQADRYITKLKKENGDVMVNSDFEQREQGSLSDRAWRFAGDYVYNPLAMIGEATFDTSWYAPRATYGGIKSFMQGKGFTQGMVNEAAKPLLTEQKWGMSATNPNGSINVPFAKQFVGKAMEAPTVLYSGAAGLVNAVTGNIAKRLVVRAAQLLPEAAINTALQAVEKDVPIEQAIKELPQDFITNEAMMFGFNALFGGLKSAKKTEGPILNKQAVKEIVEGKPKVEATKIDPERQAAIDYWKSKRAVATPKNEAGNSFRTDNFELRARITSLNTDIKGYLDRGMKKDAARLEKQKVKLEKELDKNLGIRTSFRTAEPDLHNEAKKYNSAEEFIRAEKNLGDKALSNGLEIPDTMFFGKNSKIKLRANAPTYQPSIDFLKEKIKSGGKPRVSISDNTYGRGLEVSDGNHTLEAYKQLGIKNIPVRDYSEGRKAIKQQLIDIYNQAKGGKTSFREGETKLGKADVERILQQNKKYFGDNAVEIVQKIKENENALGMHRDGIISILDGKADALDTHNHEAVHKYFSVFMDQEDAADLILAAKKKYGGDFAYAEEKMAEDFINYAKRGEGATGRVKVAFDKVIEKIKSYIGNEDKIKATYADLYSGKAKSSNTGLRAKQSAPSTGQTMRVSRPQSETLTQTKTESKVNSQEVSSNQFSKEATSPYKKVNEVTPQVNQNAPDLSTKESKIVYKNTLWDKFRTSVQDSWHNAKKLEKMGVKNKGLQASEAQELYSGRIGARLEDLTKRVKAIDEDIVKSSKNVGVDLKDDVNRYLQAMHAPERNAVHGDGAAGMTNKEAQDFLSALNDSEGAEEIKRIASDIKKLNDETLDILKDGQIIDEKTYNTLRSTYKNHVPLNRIMPEDEDIVQSLTGGRGLNVNGSGVKRAKGSEREVADILGNTYANLAEATTRAEKNRVNLATLEFARNNKASGLFEEIKPRALGMSFNGETPIFETITDPNVLRIRENGKQIYLKIKDEGLAKMYQAIGNEQLPSALKAVEAITRYYASIATRFNPEFVLSNKIRDLQEAMVNVSAREGMGFSGAAKTGARDLASMKAVTEYLAGKDTPGAKLFEQMKMDGGTTGGMSLSTRKKLEVDFENIQKLNRSNPRKAAQAVVNGIENWGTIFEDSTRLSVYKTALDKGMSREQAALLAKNATLNFNKKGTAGPIINSLYMFSNASIQGTTNTLRALKNPKVLATVVPLVATATWQINKWNDSVDPDWRNNEKTSEWDRNSNLIVMLPTTDGSVNYITIPVAWGIKPLKVMGDRFYETVNGNGKGFLKNAEDVLSSAIDAYNPIGGTDMISTMTPTVLDTPVDLARNKSWAGSDIKPKWLAGLPQADQYKKSLSESTLGKMLIGATGKVSEATGRRIDISPQDLNYVIEQAIGGGGRFIERVFNTTAGVAKGEDVKSADTPFLNRFYKEKNAEDVQKGALFSKKDNFSEEIKQYKTGSPEQQQAIQDYIISLPEDKRYYALRDLGDMGFTTKGISTSEDVIKGKPLYEKVHALLDAGNKVEARAEYNKLTKSQKHLYAAAKQSAQARKSDEIKKKNEAVIDQIFELAKNNNKDKANAMIKSLPKEERLVVLNTVKNKLKEYKLHQDE